LATAHAEVDPATDTFHDGDGTAVAGPTDS
jgi:hypothetical protein